MRAQTPTPDVHTGSNAVGNLNAGARILPVNDEMESGLGDMIIPPDPEISLSQVLSYQFSHLVHRMTDKSGWSEEKAKEVFEDLKKFLYMCGATFNGPYAPSEAIDEMWHNFILFTQDYEEFCQNHFGRFLHHRPRRKDDAPPKVDLVANTIQVASSLFGDLSSNWKYPTRVNGMDCTPSTNCQDADCHDS